MNAAVLLVVGNVSCHQWKPIRTAMVKDGLTPVIVRVPSQHADSEMLRARVTATEAGAFVEELMQLELDYLTSLLAAEGATLESVGVMLTELRPETESIDQSPWAWVVEHLPEEVAYYNVKSTADGHGFWLDGDGFNCVSTHMIRAA